jgi:DNA-binding transcriptional ArsR family regulator
MGDFELSDPKAMRALAHPARLAILTRLQRFGPATATQLSEHVGATPSVTSWHLRHLASFGLVEDWDGGTDRRHRWWQATAHGFRFESPTDDEGKAAYRLLASELLRTYEDQKHHWFAEVEPQLEDEWHRLSGASNTTVHVTLAELAEIERTIDEMLGFFVRRRDAGDVPPTARLVRVLRYVMPAAADEADDAVRPAEHEAAHQQAREHE